MRSGRRSAFRAEVRKGMAKNLSPHDKARERAYRLLAVRARSERELRAKLKERGFEEPVVEEVTARLRELNYLDDESFARQWARNLAVNRLLGNRRIAASLSEKGIRDQLIRQVLSEVREELSEEEAVFRLIRKKMDKKTAKMDDKEKRRLAQSLMGKGFPPGLVFDILKRSKEDFIDEGE
ncbi:MAG TPA: regulatory protein RecX [Syntrophales bacterium]|nr:regulatory protein RecX [Syntrophales bacterium]